MMNEYLEEMHDCRHILRTVSRQLIGLSKAAWVMGNETLSNNLDKYAEIIEQAERRISVAVTQEVNNRLTDSQASTKAVVEAALAGITMRNSNDLSDTQ